MEDVGFRRPRRQIRDRLAAIAPGTAERADADADLQVTVHHAQPFAAELADQRGEDEHAGHGPSAQPHDFERLKATAQVASRTDPAEGPSAQPERHEQNDEPLPSEWNGQLFAAVGDLDPVPRLARLDIVHVPCPLPGAVLRALVEAFNRSLSRLRRLTQLRAGGESVKDYRDLRAAIMISRPQREKLRAPDHRLGVSVVAVLHNRAADRRDHLPRVADHDRRLAAGGDLGGLFAQPVQDRPEDRRIPARAVPLIG